jgi:hypothetical protein
LQHDFPFLHSPVIYNANFQFGNIFNFNSWVPNCLALRTYVLTTSKMPTVKLSAYKLYMSVP